MPDLFGYLHEKIDGQHVDDPKLIPKYHRLVAAHSVAHTCEDDERQYAAGEYCPWIRGFASMWRRDSDYDKEWPGAGT
jgi:hypothetical protein